MSETAGSVDARFPQDVLDTASAVGAATASRLALASSALAEAAQAKGYSDDEDMRTYSDTMEAILADAILSVVVVERTRCARIVIREALKRGGDGAVFAAIAKKLREGEQA